MGRALQRPNDKARPSGPRWDALRKRLIAQWFRESRGCFYCGGSFKAPDLIEVAHLVSPLVRPDLAWSPSNLAPAHGSGKRRSAEGLACNWLGAVSPDAPKDPLTGADLPFTPEFLARQIADRARQAAKRARDPRGRYVPAQKDNGSNGKPAIPAPTAIGREWLALPGPGRKRAGDGHHVDGLC